MRGARVTFFIVLAVALLIGASVAAAAISLPKTGQTKCYSGSTEVPCAGTGQDGEEQRGAAWPSPRFTQTYCNNDGTCADQSKDCDGIWGNNLITDHVTGLQVGQVLLEYFTKLQEAGVEW